MPVGFGVRSITPSRANGCRNPDGRRCAFRLPSGGPNWWAKGFDFRSKIIPLVTRRSRQPEQTGRGHLGETPNRGMTPIRQWWSRGPPERYSSISVEGEITVPTRTAIWPHDVIADPRPTERDRQSDVEGK